MFYLLSNIFGIAFVNIANLNFYRSNPFLNKKASYDTLIITIILTPFLFVISGMIMLRHKDSVSSAQCELNSISCQGKPYTRFNSLIFNVFAWNGGFILGLQMTYTKLMKLKSFNLVPSKMKSWSRVNWLVFFIALVIVLGLIAKLGYSYMLADVQWYYFGLIILIIAMLFIPAFLFRKTRYLHLHHYNLGMILFVLIAYQSYSLALFSGLANGLFIEGVTTHDYAPVFKRKSPKEKIRRSLTEVVPVEEPKTAAPTGNQLDLEDFLKAAQRQAQNEPV